MANNPDYKFPDICYFLDGEKIKVKYQDINGGIIPPFFIAWYFSNRITPRSRQKQIEYNLRCYNSQITPAMGLIFALKYFDDKLFIFV